MAIRKKKAAIEELDVKIQKLYEEQWLINNEAGQITRQLELRGKYAAYQVEYSRYMGDFEELEKRIGEDAEIVARELRIRNKLAATLDEKRKIGKTIKAKIEKNSHCPYCGTELSYNGVDVHLDHIYPIAKGGESVPQNLVYVCKDCNQKKSDMTLRNFIRKYGLNREIVELNLDKLGKDF